MARIVNGKKYEVIKGRRQLVDFIRISGNPQEYVNNLRMPETETEVKLSRMAEIETRLYPFVAGEKMGQKAFWRNALAYFKSNRK